VEKPTENQTISTGWIAFWLSSNPRQDRNPN
jgi:hypothetical protein